MPVFKFLKNTLKIVTVFIPQARLAKLGISAAVFIMEELAKNSKVTWDDRAVVKFKESFTTNVIKETPCKK